MSRRASALSPQPITFNALAAKTFGDVEFSPGAMTSAGLALSYKSSDPTVATVSEGKIRIIGAGTATIAVAQAGDSNHLPAAPVQKTAAEPKARKTAKKAAAKKAPAKKTTKK